MAADPCVNSGLGIFRARTGRNVDSKPDEIGLDLLNNACGEINLWDTRGNTAYNDTFEVGSFSAKWVELGRL